MSDPSPSRRTLLQLGAGLGALALGCGWPGDLRAGKGPAEDPAFPLAGEIPGLRDVGPAPGGRPGPVLLQLSLNVNDFLRPEREGQAVLDWLERARSRDLWPLELSLTGHVLEAFQRDAPAVVEALREARPTIGHHERLLRYRKRVGTDRDLYDTDPRTLRLERDQPGPAVRIMQTFGVVPEAQGGVLSELLRERWTPGEETRRLLSLGFQKLRKQDHLAHPDRIVAWALDPDDGADGHRHVEAYLAVRRLARKAAVGTVPGDAGTLHTDLLRLAQVVREQGFDLAAVPGLSELLEVEEVPTAVVGFANLEPTAPHLDRLRSATQAGRADAALAEALPALAARLHHWPTLAAEIRAKLSRCRADRVYATRLVTHASNDYTVQSWSEFMAPKGTPPPFPLRPADTRPAAQQREIASTFDAVLDLLAESDRVQAASLFHDSQWAQPADALVREVYGVSLASLPGSLSASKIDAMARAAGLEPEVVPIGAGQGRGRRKRQR